MYYKGHGVQRNYVKAMKWWRKAAMHGHATAQVRLGLMYHKGHGVPKNYAEALKWYRKSAGKETLWRKLNSALCMAMGVVYRKTMRRR